MSLILLTEISGLVASTKKKGKMKLTAYLKFLLGHSFTFSLLFSLKPLTSDGLDEQFETLEERLN